MVYDKEVSLPPSSLAAVFPFSLHLFLRSFRLLSQQTHCKIIITMIATADISLCFNSLALDEMDQSFLKWFPMLIGNNELMLMFVMRKIVVSIK